MENNELHKLKALDDDTLEAVTGGDINYTYHCPQCGQIEWREIGMRPSPTFTGKPTPSYIYKYACANCERLKQQGMVDEVPTIEG